MKPYPATRVARGTCVEALHSHGADSAQQVTAVPRTARRRCPPTRCRCSPNPRRTIGRLNVQDRVERVVVVRNLRGEAREVKVVVRVLLVHLAKKLVALEAHKPRDPRRGARLQQREESGVGGWKQGPRISRGTVVQRAPSVSATSPSIASTTFTATSSATLLLNQRDGPRVSAARRTSESSTSLSDDPYSTAAICDQGGRGGWVPPQRRHPRGCGCACLLDVSQSLEYCELCRKINILHRLSNNCSISHLERCRQKLRGP